MGEINSTLKLHYDTKKEARIVKNSIEPDDESYVEIELKRTTLICKVKGEPMQLLHTLDDLLMCVDVAEKTLKI